MILLGIDCGITNYALSVLDYNKNNDKNIFQNIKILHSEKINIDSKITNKSQILVKRIRFLVQYLSDIKDKYNPIIACIEQQMKSATVNYEIMSISAAILTCIGLDVHIVSPSDKYKIMELESNFTSYRNLKEKSSTFIREKFPDVESIAIEDKKDDLTDSIFIVIQYIKRNL